MNPRLAPTPLLLPLLLSAAACTTVGPDYSPPVVAAAEQGAWLEPVDTSTVEPAWWDSFGDPLLTSLVVRAMADSPDVAEAEARLVEARANRAATLGSTYPQVDASAAASENRISENGQFPAANIPNFPTEFSLFDLGFDASWEVDLWGRSTRALEGADAQVGAAEAGRDAVLVTLSAEIARQYIDLRAAQAEFDRARDNQAAMAELARLAGLLAAAGEGNALDAEAARAQAEEAAAALPLANSRAAAAAYRIAALLGEPPEALADELLAPAPIPGSPEAILVGVRSDLLRRRPDIRRAERELAAASAEVGYRNADLFPRFSLLGGVGLQARAPDGLFEGGSLRYSIGPSFHWPIFSFGRIRSEVAAADARADAALARYEGAVADALADSESAINRWLAAKAAEDSALASLSRQRRAFQLSLLRHESGEDSRIDVTRARLPLIAAERRLAQAQGISAEAAIALYKALGGAWQAEIAVAE